MTSQGLTPVIILIATIFWTKANHGITVAEAFTSLSIINIAASPIAHILASITTLFGAIGSFNRLQTFLLSAEHNDARKIRVPVAQPHLQPIMEGNLHEESNSATIRPRQTCFMAAEKLSDRQESSAVDRNVITITNATFVVGDGQTEVLRDISMNIRQGSLTIIVGTTGCGKSSLLKAIVGEVSLVKGSTETRSDSVSYCDQTPWIKNISLRGNIIGESEYNEEWFRLVTKACALDEDMLTFPDGDSTLAGSGGVALSGGQKQRVVSSYPIKPPDGWLIPCTVSPLRANQLHQPFSGKALARAVYSRKKLTVLDDVFSGLDNRTSRIVFQRLLGIDGLLRQRHSTVVLATHNSKTEPFTSLHIDNGLLILHTY